MTQIQYIARTTLTTHLELTSVISFTDSLVFPLLKSTNYWIIIFYKI